MEKLTPFWNNLSCLAVPGKWQAFAWWPKRPLLCPWRSHEAPGKKWEKQVDLVSPLVLSDNQGPMLPSLHHHRAHRCPRKPLQLVIHDRQWSPGPYLYTHANIQKRKTSHSDPDLSKQGNALHCTSVLPAPYCLLETKQLPFWALSTMKVNHSNAALPAFLFYILCLAPVGVWVQSGEFLLAYSTISSTITTRSPAPTQPVTEVKKKNKSRSIGYFPIMLC